MGVMCVWDRQMVSWSRSDVVGWKGGGRKRHTDKGIRVNILFALITLEKESSRAAADRDCPLVSSIHVSSLPCWDWPSILNSPEARIMA